jgi:PAS domain S-box-containing protein
MGDTEDLSLAMFAAMPIGVLVIDTETHVILDANPKALVMLGTESEALIGHVCDDCICPALKGKCPITDLGQVLYRGEHKLVTARGDTVTILKTVTPVLLDGKHRLLEAFVDITEYAQAREQLRESEEKCRELYENAPNGYLSVGADRLIRTCNRSAAGLLGHTVEELTGQLVLDLYADTPDGKEKASQVLERFQAGQTIADEELQMQKADGTPVWISLTVNPIRDTTGKLMGSRWTVADITARKDAEGQAAKLAKFPSENPNPVLRVTGDGSVIYANRSAVPLLNSWGCNIGQPLPEEWRQFTAEVYGSGSKAEAEAQCDGHVLSLTFVPIVDEGYVNVYGLDRTERKLGEEVLRESKENIRLMVSEVKDYAILMLDPNGIVSTWNEGLGASRDIPLRRSSASTSLASTLKRTLNVASLRENWKWRLPKVVSSTKGGLSGRTAHASGPTL